jgi:acyl carrier protein
MTDKVFRIISQVMNIPLQRLNEDSSIDNIERWDSLTHMKLVLSLEEEFNMSFSDEEVTAMISVGKIIETLAQKGVTN